MRSCLFNLGQYRLHVQRWKHIELVSNGLVVSDGDNGAVTGGVYASGCVRCVPVQSL